MSPMPSSTPTVRESGRGVFAHHDGPRDRSSSHAGSAVRSVTPRPGWSTPDQIYVPPGWPEAVQPPAGEEWIPSAVAFLLDCCPSDYRGHQVLRRHPVVLARLAAQFVESQIRASREALASTRAGLGDVVGPDVLDSTVDVLHSEEARLVRVRRGVLLVEEALRGRVFIRKL